MGLYIHCIDLHTMEFYSATKKNEIMLFKGKWMELESIMEYYVF
jgi:hypothetical protein